MIIVKIDERLLVDALTVGTVFPVFKVMKGIPYGCKLAAAQVIHDGGLTTLHLAFDDRSEVDTNSVVQFQRWFEVSYLEFMRETELIDITNECAAIVNNIVSISDSSAASRNAVVGSLREYLDGKVKVHSIRSYEIEHNRNYSDSILVRVSPRVGFEEDMEFRFTL